MASNEHHNEVRPIMDPTKNYEEINSYCSDPKKLDFYFREA